jgi:hypothetical protein
MSTYNNSFSSRSKWLLLSRKLQMVLPETIYSDYHHFHHLPPLLFIGNLCRGLCRRHSSVFSYLEGLGNEFPAGFPKPAVSRRVVGINLHKHSSVFSVYFNHSTFYDSGRFLVTWCGNGAHQHGLWVETCTVRCNSELGFMAPYFKGWLV